VNWVWTSFRESKRYPNKGSNASNLHSDRASWKSLNCCSNHRGLSCRSLCASILGPSGISWWEVCRATTHWELATLIHETSASLGTSQFPVSRKGSSTNVIANLILFIQYSLFSTPLPHILSLPKKCKRTNFRANTFPYLMHAIPSFHIKCTFHTSFTKFPIALVF